jgi:hypothetical protein
MYCKGMVDLDKDLSPYQITSLSVRGYDPI